MESRRLLEDVQAHRVAFLAGSGVSNAVGLPSATDVLQATKGVFLDLDDPDSLSDRLARVGTFGPSLRRLLERIQPEILYEILLRNCNNDRRALAIWEALSPVTWKGRTGLYPRPSLTHLFLVDYAWRTGIPILTTNFDTLFEQAAVSLTNSGFDDYRGMAPSKVVCHVGPRAFDDVSPSDFGERRLTIVKIHGSISGRDAACDFLGQCDIDTLHSTMTQIAQREFAFLESLQRLMTRQSLAIVGYSGRDVDIFPNIRAFAHLPSSKPVYWINDFRRSAVDPASRVSYENARSVPAARIIGDVYPEKLLRENIDQWITESRRRSVLLELAPNPDEVARTKASKKRLLDSLVAELRKYFHWTDQQRLVLLGQLYVDAGMYNPAYTLLKHALRTAVDSAISDKSLLIRAVIEAAHNTSRYCEIPRLVAILADGVDSSRATFYRIVVESYLVEAERMQIPFDTFLFRDVGVRLYHRELCSVYERAEAFRSMVESLLRSTGLGRNLAIDLDHVKRTRPEDYPLAISVQHNLIESEIRRTAIRFAITKPAWLAPSDQPDYAPAVELAKDWDELEERSYLSGYANGLINSYKFKSRLPPEAVPAHSSLDSDAARLAVMLSHSTADELLVRNRAEAVLLAWPSKQDGPRQVIEDLLSMHSKSKASGNRLNRVKSILGIGEYNRVVANQRNFDNLFIARGTDYLPELERLIGNLRLEKWSELLRELRHAFPQDPSLLVGHERT